MKQCMSQRGVLQEITPLRSSVPFFRAAAAQRSWRKPSLLTRHVQRGLGSTPPPTPLPPHHASPSSDSSSSSGGKSTEQHHAPDAEASAAAPPTAAPPTASSSSPLQPSTTPADHDVSSSSSSEADGATQPPHQKSPDHVPGSKPAPPSRPKRPAFAFQKPSPATVLATYGAYIGAIGTVAVGTAYAADINLAAMFHWTPQAVEQALLTLIPLALLNTLIMLPDYSTWSLPDLDEQEENEISASASLALVPEPDAAAAATKDSKIKKTPASTWGKKKENLRVFKDALHLAQGHYTANNPTVNMHPAVEVLTASAQSLAGELLYRGVTISLLQAWLLDRFYEAGADDVVLLPLLSQPIDTSAAASWAAALSLVLLSTGLALRKVYNRPQPRIIKMLELRQGEQGKGGAGKGRGSSGSSSSSSSSTKEVQLPRSFTQVTTLAAGVQGARNVLQMAVLNVVFVMTGGNLAASVTASLANQLLFSVLQHYSMQRMQQRSATMAKELEVFNLRLRDIQRRKQARLSAAAAAAVATAEAPAATDEGEGAATQQPHSDPGWEPSVLSQASLGTGEADGLRMHGQLHGEGAVESAVSGAQGGSQGEVLMHAAAVATAASAAVDAAAQGGGGVAATAAAGGGPGAGPLSAGPDQLTRALMALDLLLPPEPSPPSKSQPPKK